MKLKDVKVGMRVAVLAADGELDRFSTVKAVTGDATCFQDLCGACLQEYYDYQEAK